MTTSLKAFGLYASATSRKKLPRSGDSSENDAEEEKYFLAGRNTPSFVVGISLVSGLTSGISFLGSTGYAFTNGFAIGVTAFSPLLAAPIIVYILIPFFRAIEAVSAYEYLSLRFSPKIRTLASSIFIIRVVVYLGLVLYAPAIAVKAVSGIHEAVTIVVAGVTSTIYTSKGGMPSVVWTDFLQTLVLTTATVYVLWKCFSSITTDDFEKALRIDRDFAVPDPVEDLTLYSAFFGVGISSLAQGGTDQVAIQRYLTTRDLRACQRAVALTWLFNGLYCGLLGVTGVALYAFYHSEHRVDPLENDEITSCDMILPFFASHDLPEPSGGILLSGIVGCTMSVCGAGLNSASTCLVVDIFPPAPGSDVVYQTRIATFVLGSISVCAALLFMVAGDTLITLNQYAFGFLSAPLLTLFTLGIIFPRANAFGAWCSVGGNMLAVCYIAGSLLIRAPPFVKISPFWFTAVISSCGVLCGFVASYRKPPPSSSQTDGLTLWTRTSRLDSKYIGDFADDPHIRSDGDSKIALESPPSSDFFESTARRPPSFEEKLSKPLLRDAGF